MNYPPLIVLTAIMALMVGVLIGFEAAKSDDRTQQIKSNTPTVKPTEDAKEEVETEVPFFITVHKCNGFDVVCCTETKVLYTKNTDRYNPGSLTLLVNPDGTPMVYTGTDIINPVTPPV